VVARDMPDPGLVARRAYENGQRDERALTEMGF
jgi:DNA-binding HxlR family transcriptional regulator